MRHVLITAILVSLATATTVIADQHNNVPVFHLNNNYTIPAIGLGTWKLEDAESVVKDAIDVGYRHFDTAYRYGNERELGYGINAKIAEGVIKREDVFVTAKIWSTFHEPELVFRQFNRTFEKLNISYIDLLLIHYPISYGIRHKDGSDSIPHDVEDFESYPKDKNGSMVYVEVDPKDTWRAFEKLVHNGLVRSIGLSNFNSHQVDYILSIAEIKPVINQVEIHPNLSQLKLIEFLKSRNMVVTAYSALGRPHSVNDTDMAFRHPTVQKLAIKYQKTPAQVILRFVHQLGVAIASNAVLKNHLIDNLNIFDFCLSQDDMNIMHKFNNNHRLSKFIHDVNHKDYPFKIEY